MDINHNKYDNFLFEIFLQNLRKSLTKSQYKKTLIEIKSQENNYLYLEEYWKLVEIKIRVYLKLIEKRLYKYNNLHPKYILIEKLLDKTNEELEMFYSIIEYYDTDSNQMEIYLQLYLLYSFNLAIFFLNGKNLAEAVGVLGMSDKLITNSLNFMKKAETCSISQRILILLSAVLIADNDYESAKNYQRKCIRLNHMELIRLNINEPIDLSKYSIKEAYNFEKVFLNMMLIFYHHGVCEENLGNLFSSSISYKSAKWVIIKFFKSKIPGLIQFLTDVCNTLGKVSRLFSNLNSYSNGEINNKLYTKLPSKRKEDKNVKSQERSTKIKEMKFQEVEMWDGNQRNDRIKQILYSVRLYNTIMSKEFKDVLDKMNQLDLHNLDKETKEMIQKRCNQIRSEEHYKKLNKQTKSNCKFTNYSVSSQYNFTEGNDPQKFILDMSKKKGLSSHKATTAINTSNCSRNSSKENLKISTVKKDLFLHLETTDIYNKTHRKDNKSNKTKNKKPLKIRETENTENVEMYKMEKYFFSSKYQKKRKHMSCVYDRELNFQKKLLNLKKKEIEPVKLFSNKKGVSTIIRKNLLNLVLIKNVQSVKDNVKDNGRNEILDRNIESSKNELKKVRLEVKVTKSLDMKSYLEYKEHLGKIRNTQVKIRKEYLLGDNIKTNEEIDRLNNNIARRIENDLETLIKIEQIQLKENKKKNRNNSENKIQGKMI